MSDRWQLLMGDNVASMKAMPDASIDAVVCDPPYGISFMGNAWDGKAIAEATRRDEETRRSLGPPSQDGRAQPRSASAYSGRSNQAGSYDLSLKGLRGFQAWCEVWGAEALRVLKPGGHLVAFGSPRTYHRLTSGLEDAGFEIRDCLLWLFGQGFPKSGNISKMIDRRLGAEREVVGTMLANTAMQGGNFASGPGPGGQPIDLTVPSSPEAKQWDGWGTTLKPGYEPIVLARKPPVGSVIDSILAHGTGALNIDGCRIEHVGESGKWGAKQNVPMGYAGGNDHEGFRTAQHPGGRWPANVIADEEAGAVIDADAGDRGGGFGTRGVGGSIYGNGNGWSNNFTEIGQGVGYGDEGGPSRFFYCPKTTSAERNAGLTGMQAQQLAKADKWTDVDHRRSEDGEPTSPAHENDHPTVKPIDLMRWLCRLVTPPGGRILDPFTGSGSTGCGALLEGFRFVGLENHDPYEPIIRARLGWWAQREGETDEIVVAAVKERKVIESGQLGLLG